MRDLVMRKDSYEDGNITLAVGRKGKVLSTTESVTVAPAPSQPALLPTPAVKDSASKRNVFQFTASYCTHTSPPLAAKKIHPWSDPATDVAP